MKTRGRENVRTGDKRLEINTGRERERKRVGEENRQVARRLNRGGITDRRMEME